MWLVLGCNAMAYSSVVWWLSWEIHTLHIFLLCIHKHVYLRLNMYISVFQYNRLLHVFGYRTCRDCFVQLQFCHVALWCYLSVALFIEVWRPCNPSSISLKISVKDRSPLTPQIISSPKFLVHPCEFVPFITKVLPVGIGSYCSFISNIWLFNWQQLMDILHNHSLF